MQKWIGTGNLTKDVEMVGENLAKFTMAIPEDYVKEDGERPTQFFTVICWNKLAENCVKYLKKGNKVFVCGKLQNRSYTASDGTTRYVTEIIAREVEFLVTKKEENTQPEQKTSKDKMIPITDDTLPF